MLILSLVTGTPTKKFMLSRYPSTYCSYSVIQHNPTHLNINYLTCGCYCCVQIGEDPDVVAAQPPVRNSPRFAEFAVEDGDSSYYIFVEQMRHLLSLKLYFYGLVFTMSFTFHIHLHLVTFVLFFKNLFLDCLRRVNVVLLT